MPCFQRNYVVPITKTVIGVTILALLVYTNPTMENYGEFIRNKIVQETRKQDNFSKVLGSLFGGIVSGVITNTTIRKDFIIFSFYNTDLEKENIKVVGILNNFIVLHPLESKTDNIELLELEQDYSPNSKYTNNKPQPEQYEPSTEFAQVLNSHELDVCMREFFIVEPDFKSEDLSHLEEWAGRYPTKSFGNTNKLDFFAVPQVSYRLRLVLSKMDFEKVTAEYAVESPIELIDNYLFISRCKPHSCSKNALIALSLHDGSIFIMFAVPNHTEPYLYERRCYAIKSDLHLPKNIQERFLVGF